MHAAKGSNVLRRGMSQESECITIQTDCYSFATLMWDCATRGYAWQGFGLLHVRSALVGLVAWCVCLFVCGLDDPRSGDDEGGRREHAAANAAREAGTTQLAKLEHKCSQTQTRTLAYTGGLARMRVVFRAMHIRWHMATGRGPEEPQCAVDWPTYRLAAVSLLTRGRKSASPRRVFSGEHTYPRASVESAPCIGCRSTGWVSGALRRGHDRVLGQR